MSEYCIYTITDEEVHFSGCCTIIKCANDKEAILAAEQWVDSHDVELWENSRFHALPPFDFADVGLRRSAGAERPHEACSRPPRMACSSSLVARSSSLCEITLMISSFVSGHGHRGLLATGRAPQEAGCIVCDRNVREGVRRKPHLQLQSRF
jgi:hypothetical protein